VRIPVVLDWQARDQLTVRDVNRVFHVWTTLSHAFDAVKLSCRRNGHIIATFFLIAKHHFTNQHQGVFLASSIGILHALGEHICKVDASAEHVTRVLGFRWSDAKTLTQDAHKVLEL